MELKTEHMHMDGMFMRLWIGGNFINMGGGGGCRREQSVGPCVALRQRGIIGLKFLARNLLTYRDNEFSNIFFYS